MIAFDPTIKYSTNGSKKEAYNLAIGFCQIILSALPNPITYPKSTLEGVANKLEIFIKHNPYTSLSGEVLVGGELQTLYKRVTHLKGLFSFLSTLPEGALHHVEDGKAVLYPSAKIPEGKYCKNREKGLLDQPWIKVGLVVVALLVIVAAADLYFGIGIIPSAIRNG